MTADKTGYSGEVWNCIAGKRFENNIIRAIPFNFAAGGNAL